MGQRLLFVKLFLILFLLSAVCAVTANAGTDLPTPADETKDSTDVLGGFSAKIKDSKIYINWKITNPQDVAFFEVERRDASKKLFESLNRNDKLKKNDYFEKSTDDKGIKTYRYNFEDEVDRDGVYYYRIKAINDNNQLMFQSDEIKVGISGLKDFKLEQNSPNPFNPTTNISYEVFENGPVKLKVFDLIGKEIAVLVNEFQSKGIYKVVFDASLYSNLTSGIYFYKLETERYTDVKKMILTK